MHRPLSSRRLHPRLNSIARWLAIPMTFVALLGSLPAHGAPGDIFSVSAPAIGTDPPKSADVREGDTAVSSQTGAFQYSYAIEIAPGRNGMVPHIALTYSSQAPIYGG